MATTHRCRECGRPTHPYGHCLWCEREAELAQLEAERLEANVYAGQPDPDDW